MLRNLLKGNELPIGGETHEIRMIEVQRRLHMVRTYASNGFAHYVGKQKDRFSVIYPLHYLGKKLLH